MGSAPRPEQGQQGQGQGQASSMLHPGGDHSHSHSHSSTSMISTFAAKPGSRAPTPTPTPTTASTAPLPSAPALTITSPTPTPAATRSNPLEPPRPRREPITPPQPQRVASLRGSLPRRRSSYPPSAPAQTPDTEAALPNVSDLFAELGLPDPASMWTPVGWDTLLNFEGAKQENDPFSALGLPPVAGPSSSMSRIHSDPGSERNIASSSKGMSGAGPVSLEPTKLAQYGSDLAWKTILASQVEVESVGQVGVTKVLQEVWRRGGGEQVTRQGLWPNIIISLSLPETESPGFRLPSPPAHAAVALQNLYNLTLRHWEPSIFTGLLAQFGAAARQDLDLSAMLGAVAQSQSAAGTGARRGVFGVSTPQKELDMSQWTTLTPSGDADWSFLNALDPDSLPSIAAKQPSALAYDFLNERRGSTTKSTEDDGVRGLDEILAQMEEGNNAREVAAIREQIEAAALAPDLPGLGRKRPDEVFSMPTPETDSSDVTTLSRTDQNRQASFHLVTPPSSNGSPFVAVHTVPPRAPGGQSAISRQAQLPTPASSSQSISRLTNKTGMQLTMPTAAFVPPPPMCMFFSPAFYDQEKGKMGVWKGDLEIRGKGGGKFSVLIIGEQATGHMWQSASWPKSVVYPPEPQANEETTATASMIPVSHLAREGFTPAAMGMVLCNDANIEAYVQMVQGLHAEGVAFHLTTPGRLPIVFLPAKFNSNDPLQRLGVAFMTKPGGLPSMPSSTRAAQSTSPTPASANRDLETEAEDQPKKKKRRQSAPASAMAMPRANARQHKKRESVTGMRKPGGIAEQVIVETD